MQKRSHKLLAASLLHAHQGFGPRRYEWAFLFGSFQPDCNPLTYLRGICSTRRPQGHNFASTRLYIGRCVEKLQRRSHWGIWHYYTLGKLTHYLADAFTYPHNDAYPDTLLDHRRYETALRLSLMTHLSTHKLSPKPHCHDLTDAIDRLHRQYQSARSSIQRDIRYILEANSLLMAGCRPRPFASGDFIHSPQIFFQF